GVALLRSNRKLVLGTIPSGAIASAQPPPMFNPGVMGADGVVKQVFDSAADPGELHNRYTSDEAETRELAEALKNAYNDLSRKRARRVKISLREETKPAVMALGYLMGTDVTEQHSMPNQLQAADADPQGDLGWARAK